VIIRGISVGYLVRQMSACTKITRDLILQLINYICWNIIFFGFGLIIHYQKTNFLKMFYTFTIGNFVFKTLNTLSLGFSEDLLGICYLKINFKKWFWTINCIEFFIFGYCVYKVRKYERKAERI